MTIEKDDLFFSDKQEWQDYADHILEVKQEKQPDNRRAAQDTVAARTQAN